MRKPSCLAATGIALLIALAPVLVQAAAEATADSYEVRARGAVPAPDLATLLAPFVESCGGEMRELDRARCRSTTAFLRKRLPQQTFVLTSSDPAAVEVSGYDGAIKGYHLALTGCVACTDPVPIGPQRQPRFITLNTPDKGAGSLAAGVTVSKSTVAFDDFAAAKRWAETERPFLRAEFLFQPQPTGADYTVGMAPGIALKLVGARVYNRCNGEILVSKPPSTGFADRPGKVDAACAAGAKAALAGDTPHDDVRPEQLSKASINEVMESIRARLYGCFEKFHVPGALVLNYVVGGNGTVQSVQVGSTFAGTPTGTCALEIAKDVKFPAFKRPREQFHYLFFLRRP
ncbi:MAG: hypothetical protein ACJ8F1_24430 [Polyangia bacterium]